MLKTNETALRPIRGDAAELAGWGVSYDVQRKIEAVYGTELFATEEDAPARWVAILEWCATVLPYGALRAILASWAEQLCRVSNIKHHSARSIVELLSCDVSSAGAHSRRAALLVLEAEEMIDTFCRIKGLPALVEKDGELAAAAELPPETRAWAGLRALACADHRAASGCPDSDVVAAVSGAARWIAWALDPFQPEKQTARVLTWSILNAMAHYTSRFAVPGSNGIALA